MKVEKLGNLVKTYSGGTPLTANRKFYNGTINFIGSGDIKKNKVKKKITNEAIEKSSSKMIVEGSLLYALYGATAGEVSISKISGAINQAVLCIECHGINKLFLYQYFLKNKDHIVNTFCQGGQPNLSAGNIKSLMIKLPSLDKQKQIGNFLSNVDKLIESKREEIKLKEEYKKGIIQKIFNKEIRFKDEDGNYYPEWEYKKIENCVSFSKGKGISKSEITTFGTKCIRYADLFTKYNTFIDEVNTFTMVEGNYVYTNKNFVLMPTSDVTPTGLATASAIDEENIVIGGDILIMECKEVNNKFLATYIRHDKKQILKLVSGTTVFHIYEKDMKNFVCPIPKWKEQKASTDLIEKMEFEIKKMKIEYVNLKVLKDFLISTSFGKVLYE